VARLDVLRRATERPPHPGPRLTVYPEYVLDPSAGSTRPALPRARLERRRGPRTRRLVVLGRRGPSAAVGRHRCAPAGRLLPGCGERSGRGAGRGRPRPAGRRGRDRHPVRRTRPEVRQVAEVADDLRRQIMGDEVTFVANRNINYTNVCTFKCRFCAFSKGPLSLNLRGAPYLLELDEITRRVAEAEALGAPRSAAGWHPPELRRRLLRGRDQGRARGVGHHPHPRLHRPRGHRGAKRSEVSLADYLVRLREAGLKTFRGPPREILDDPVRAVLCPTRSTPRSGSKRTAPPTASGCAPT